MDLLNFINTYWQVLGGIVSFVAIVVIGKKQLDLHESRITALEVEHKTLNNKLFEEITKLREDLAQIKGVLSVREG